MSQAPDIDPSETAAAAAADEAAALAELEAQQLAAMAVAQENAVDDVDDDVPDLAELAAEDGDPFDDDVEEIEDTDDTATADIEDTPIDVVDDDSGTEDTDDADVDGPVTDAAADSDDAATDLDAPAQPDTASSDTEEVADVGVDAAPVADADTSTEDQPATGADDGATTMTAQSISEFQQRLYDERARRGIAPAPSRQEAYTVRRQLEDARKRGVEMGLLDPDVAAAFDAELEYSDSTLGEDQRNSHGPGSPMYEEARRLGYVRDDRTQGVSSMRLREDDAEKRRADERLRFNHYWQQQDALSRIDATKMVMIAQDSDSGSRAGFAQLGALVADLSIGDAIDEADIEAYIAVQHSETVQETETVGATLVQHEPATLLSTQPDSVATQPQQFTPVSVAQAPIMAEHNNKNVEKDTHVEIQEFIAAWNEFTDVERRIVLLRTGLVDANDMEQMYTQLQETVTSRTNERDRFQSECDQLRAELEYEVHARRDVERELANLRQQVQPAQE